MPVQRLLLAVPGTYISRTVGFCEVDCNMPASWIGWEPTPKGQHLFCYAGGMCTSRQLPVVGCI